MAPSAAPASSYRVKCASCRQEFEALDTAICACLVAEPTVVCNNCHACSCKAPYPWKKAFWADAPESLWDRKMEVLRRRRPAKERPEPSAVGRPLVLLVENNHAVQRAAGRVIGAHGFSMILAENGDDGFELAKTYRPEVIVAEAFVPKLDGREMCRRLRTEGLSTTKMIIVTGLYRSTAHRQEALREFRVDEYLTKPLRSRGPRLGALEDPVVSARAGDRRGASRPRACRRGTPRGRCRGSCGGSPRPRSRAGRRPARRGRRGPPPTSRP
jgi:CheY-like chemotaxis protein